MKTSNFPELIPELATWNNGTGIDISGFLCAVGRYDHAVAYSTLFWPAFVEYDDCVLFENFSVSSFDGFMRQTEGNRRAVEAVMNHIHIIDIFSACEPEPSREQVVYLGEILREVWSCKLARDFPNRTVVVSFPIEEYEDLLDYQITFFTNRGAA